VSYAQEQFIFCCGDFWLRRCSWESVPMLMLSIDPAEYRKWQIRWVRGLTYRDLCLEELKLFTPWPGIRSFAMAAWSGLQVIDMTIVATVPFEHSPTAVVGQLCGFCQFGRCTWLPFEARRVLLIHSHPIGCLLIPSIQLWSAISSLMSYLQTFVEAIQSINRSEYFWRQSPMISIDKLSRTHGDIVRIRNASL
jgi:hypothetical protein